jgi:hypothetical protein
MERPDRQLLMERATIGIESGMAEHRYEKMKVG